MNDLLHLFLSWLIGWAIAICVIIALLAFAAGSLIQHYTAKPTIVYVTNSVPNVSTNR